MLFLPGPLGGRQFMVFWPGDIMVKFDKSKDCENADYPWQEMDEYNSGTKQQTGDADDFY
jgi:hypothetical protein